MSAPDRKPVVPAIMWGHISGPQGVWRIAVYPRAAIVGSPIAAESVEL